MNYEKQMTAVVEPWALYLENVENWEELVAGVEPKQTGCGPIYELPNPIARPNESFAIADMRDVRITEPHYHINGETEIYIVLQGLGSIVVGTSVREQQLSRGSALITPPETVHYTLPRKDLILAVINTPPFNAENYVVLTETNEAVGFDQEQFTKLSRRLA